MTMQMPTRLTGSNPLARYEINSGSTVEPGELVALNASGKAVPAADTADLTIVGIALRVVNSRVEIEDGIFALANGTGDAALGRGQNGNQ